LHEVFGRVQTFRQGRQLVPKLDDGPEAILPVIEKLVVIDKFSQRRRHTTILPAAERFFQARSALFAAGNFEICILEGIAYRLVPSA
jgi:hypothetical protein